MRTCKRAFLGRATYIGNIREHPLLDADLRECRNDRRYRLHCRIIAYSVKGVEKRIFQTGVAYLGM